jgi:hypothetical protein
VKKKEKKSVNNGFELLLLCSLPSLVNLLVIDIVHPLILMPWLIYNLLMIFGCKIRILEYFQFSTILGLRK